MTPDERIEELLSRAGQTISDLPKCAEDGSIEYYTERLESLAKAARAFDRDSIYRTLLNIQIAIYALHLTDIIDRMETALENVCGERDYLKQIIEQQIPCEICVTKECCTDDEPCNSCLQPDDETMVNYEYEGVPENWRPDDSD